MKWLENIIAFFVPDLLIESSPWREEWDRQQKEAFIRLSRFTLPACAVGWMVNHYLFDVAMGLEPIQFWFEMRLAISTVLLLAGLFYFTDFVKIRGYKLPAFVGIFAICHAQAWVAIWYGKEAWFFFFLFVLVGNLMLRLNPLQSLLWGGLVILVSAPVLLDGGVGFANLMSGTIASLTVSLIVRATALTETRLFLVNQENAATQKQMIDMNAEYTERVKSFIPKVIATRLSGLMERDRLSVVEASIEALKAKKKTVSCLFTDIRGFTQGSKDIDSFVSESVLPEVTACSEAIESLEGIPRKVGDLIFAYFDDDKIENNVARALLSGIEVSRINDSINRTLGAVEIRRYILISTGEALVGNFGGLDSSVEITALGSPVNLLSRIDDLTKSPTIAEVLEPGDLLLCENTAYYAKEMRLNFEILDLKKLGLEVRDFPEVDRIYRMKPTEELYERLITVVKNQSTHATNS